MELSQVWQCCTPGVTWNTLRYVQLGVTWKTLRYVHQGSHGALSGMTVLYTMGHMELPRVCRPEVTWNSLRYGSVLHQGSHGTLSGMYSRGNIELSQGIYTSSHMELSHVCQ